MNKELLVTIGKRVVFATEVITHAIGGGMLAAMSVNQLSKRFGFLELRKAAALAHLHDLKKGDVIEVVRADVGIPLIAGKEIIDIAQYAVIDIKSNGKYKMQYVGSRGPSLEEVKLFLDL